MMKLLIITGSLLKPLEIKKMKSILGSFVYLLRENNIR